MIDANSSILPMLALLFHPVCLGLTKAASEPSVELAAFGELMRHQKEDK